MHVIGTAGHVDHGKSSLVEALTGIDPDRWAEEKRRGLTIDLGFAWLATPSGAEIGIVDVPGHERFIKNMLAGAGGISICLFVVAANEGWMPQSTEHLTAIDLLGVDRGVVAITKADLVGDEELELVTAEVEERLAGTSLAGASLVVCSTVDKRGLDRLVAALGDVVETAPPGQGSGRPRLWIDRAFTIAGAGTVVTGTLTGGRLHVGQEVSVVPAGRRAHIRSIQTHRRRTDEAAPNSRVALNLSGLARDEAARGDAIVEPDRWHPTQLFDALIRIAPEELMGRRHTLTGRGSHLLYCGSAETQVKLTLLERDELESGETGYARIRTREPLVLQRGDRFVLRDAGRVLTFGGGMVLDPLPRGSTKNASVSVLARIASASPEESLTAILDKEDEMTFDEAFLRTGARSAPGAVELAERIVSVARYESLRATALNAARDWHRSRPLERGMPREAMRKETGLPPRDFDAFIGGIEELTDEGPVVRSSNFSIQFEPEEANARHRVLATLDSSEFKPPLAADLGVDPALLRVLEQSGEIVKIGEFYLTAAHAGRARALVRSEIERQGPRTVAQIRDLLGTTRKYAVPLCEWLDQTGATLRRDDLRILGPAAD